MQTLRIYTTLIFDTVFSNFSEFPNNMRPPCTTMPWTIWPALLVLWGVCWMFETRPNTVDEIQLQLSLAGCWADAIYKFWYARIPRNIFLVRLIYYCRHSFNPFETPTWTSQDISNYLLSEDSIFFSNSFGGLNDVEFNQIPPSMESNRALHISSEQLAPSLLVQQVPPNFASPIDVFSSYTSVEQYPITAFKGKHSKVPLHHENSTVGFTVGASTQIGRTASSPQTSTNSTRSERPIQNSNDEIIYDHLDCSSKNLIFTNIREW